MHIKKGGIEYLSALMLFCLIGLLFMFSLNSRHLGFTQKRLRDALDTACLSAAIVDEYDYREKGVMRLNNNPSWLRYLFYNTLKNNLNLDNNLKPVNDEMFDGIKIHSFVLYYIQDGFLYEYAFGQDYNFAVNKKVYTGNEKTPDGKQIVSATVYGDIGMNIETFLGIKEYVHLQSSVDVVDTE